MTEVTDRYTATRLLAELGLEIRKMQGYSEKTLASVITLAAAKINLSRMCFNGNFEAMVGT